MCNTAIEFYQIRSPCATPPSNSIAEPDPIQIPPLVPELADEPAQLRIHAFAPEVVVNFLEQRLHILHRAVES